ncbi:hypothetical protein [Nostoc sp. CHAB 5836]|uniref:hypothetical protein n=1 Tax=Nostoc sp. CHAB 5836 TaxID=2780404 RepID=UPI001E62AA02|nr:hypothetical protein [Nostoc sp. CHAB 5836]
MAELPKGGSDRVFAGAIALTFAIIRLAQGDRTSGGIANRGGELVEVESRGRE